MPQAEERAIIRDQETLKDLWFAACLEEDSIWRSYSGQFVALAGAKRQRQIHHNSPAHRTQPRHYRPYRDRWLEALPEEAMHVRSQIGLGQP